MTYTLVMISIYIAAVVVIAYVIWRTKLKKDNSKRKLERCILTRNKTKGE